MRKRWHLSFQKTFAIEILIKIPAIIVVKVAFQCVSRITSPDNHNVYVLSALINRVRFPLMKIVTDAEKLYSRIHKPIQITCIK